MSLQRAKNAASLAEIVSNFSLQILEETNLRVFVWGDLLAVSVIRNTGYVDQFTGWNRDEIEEMIRGILMKYPS